MSIASPITSVRPSGGPIGATPPRGPMPIALAAAVAVVVAAVAGLPGWALASASACLVCVAGIFVARQRAEVTRLNETRRDIQRAHAQLKGLYENVAAACVSFGPNGSPVGANAALIRMLGYATDVDFLSADFSQYSFAGPGTFEALLLRTKLNGEVPIAEFNLRRRDGVQLMTAANIRAYWNDEGEVAGFEATMLDISDLKVAERQRRSMERRFRRLFDSNAVGIMFGNLRRGTLDEANDRVGELFGLRASELPVLLDSLASTEGIPLSETIEASLESSGHQPPTERLLVRRDGSRVGLLICAAVLDPLQGDFVGVVVEREIVGELTNSANGPGLHESILDAAPLVIARFDLAGGLTYCNKAFIEWFEFSAAPVGWSLEDLLGEECQRSLVGLLGRVRAGLTETASMDLFRVGGRLHRVEATFAPHYRADGSLGGSVLVVRDQTKTAPNTAAAAAVSVLSETTYNI